MAESFDKNMIDKDEYPQTAAMEMRCVNMLSRLWHAPDPDKATGCSTTGSSEAAMLGGLALKRRWQQRRKAEGKPADKPNLVMGINVQVCWDKFANYWDVEMRLVPMEGDRYHLSPEEAVKLCDENTIGVVAMLGSTFDGSYEQVKEISEPLDDLQERTGLDIPMHVDGASGGFIAPFLDPDLEWDFRLPRVQSINASGHKYGLVYPGVGWAIWRDAEALPEDLIFWVNYLGDDMPTFALNFSRPGAQVVAQYYNFLRLGFEATGACRATRARWPCTRRRRSRSWARSSCSRAATSCRCSPSSSRTTSRTSRSSTSPRRCASAAGRCRPTRSPRTARTWRRCASWCAAASPSTWPTCCSTTCASSSKRLEKLAAPVTRQGGRLPPLSVAPQGRSSSARGPRPPPAAEATTGGCDRMPRAHPRL